MHLLSVIANLALLSAALDAGNDAGINYLLDNNARILFDVFKVFVFTFVYQGLLELEIVLR